MQRYSVELVHRAQLANSPEISIGGFTYTAVLTEKGGWIVELDAGSERRYPIEDALGGENIRIEVILVVAMIPVGRNAIRPDFAEPPAPTLFALGTLTMSLSAGYFLVTRAAAHSGRRNPAAWLSTAATKASVPT